MRFAIRNERLTQERHFQDSRSCVGLRIDGSERVELQGKDMTALRQRVFIRDGYLCRDGGGIGCDGPLELSHRPAMGTSGGSDVESQCFTACQKHHREYDLHGEKGFF